MTQKTTSLDWIYSQKQAMIEQLIAWSAINSCSVNLPGLARMLTALEIRFSSLNGRMEKISLPPRNVFTSHGELTTLPSAQALRITKRQEAPVKVFLAGHMDTVYSPSHPFQTAAQLDNNILRGPGVADMKGGLLILLTALEALEKHSAATNIGWEVLINPDEEIGSIGSGPLFREAAKRNVLALIFEPSFADGAIVSSRKGSMNVSIVARGRAAHAGRDFDKGRNAIVALADFISKTGRLNDQENGISVNPGYIYGGGPVNIVPDLAFCRLNARAIQLDDFTHLEQKLKALAEENTTEGIQLSLYVETRNHPKTFDERSHHLFKMLNECAKEEGYSLFHRPSGGVCDGNILAAEGLPVIDTLGAIGGEIHTQNEYIAIDSLVQRSRLAALYLIKLAQNPRNVP